MKKILSTLVLASTLIATSSNAGDFDLSATVSPTVSIVTMPSFSGFTPDFNTNLYLDQTSSVSVSGANLAVGGYSISLSGPNDNGTGTEYKLGSGLLAKITIDGNQMSPDGSTSVATYTGAGSASGTYDVVVTLNSNQSTLAATTYTSTLTLTISAN